MNLKKLAKKLTVEEIYALIRKFDYEVGECFIDYNESYIQNSNLAFYLLGKGLITKDIFNRLISDNLLRTCDLNEILSECNIDDDLEKRFILAEITQNFDVFLGRLIKAYKEYDLDFSISKNFIKEIKPEINKFYKGRA